MEERFSDEAMRTIRGSRQQALQLESGAIGTEHLLLSLLIEGDGAARKALEMLAIRQESIRDGVLAVAIARPTPVRLMAVHKSPESLVPFTTEANQVLVRAEREALKLGHGYTGAEHILLGLIRERDGLAGRVLADLGANLDTARGVVAGLVEKDGIPADVPAEWRHPKPRLGMGSLRRRRQQSQ